MKFRCSLCCRYDACDATWITLFFVFFCWWQKSTIFVAFRKWWRISEFLHIHFGDSCRHLLAIFSRNIIIWSISHRIYFIWKYFFPPLLQNCSHMEACKAQKLLTFSRASHFVSFSEFFAPMSTLDIINFANKYLSSVEKYDKMIIMIRCIAALYLVVTFFVVIVLHSAAFERVKVPSMKCRHFHGIVWFLFMFSTTRFHCRDDSLP